MKEIRAAVIALPMLWPALVLAEDSARVNVRGGWAGPNVGTRCACSGPAMATDAAT